MRAAQSYTIVAFVPVCPGIFAGHRGPLLPVGGGVWPAAGYPVFLSLGPCRVCDTEPSIVAHMPSRLLGRLNAQTFATLSAVRYGLVRRIGFLFMPPMSCIGGSLPATVRLIGRSVSQIC